MENTIRMPFNAFKLYARNMHSKTYSESGRLVKVYDKVVEVIDGDITLGEHDCIYTCDDLDNSIDVSSKVRKHTETSINEPASNSEGGSDDCYGYIAKVRVIEQTKFYNSNDGEPTEGSEVKIVECI